MDIDMFVSSIKILVKIVIGILNVCFFIFQFGSNILFFQNTPSKRTAQKKLAEDVTLLVHGGMFFLLWISVEKNNEQKTKLCVMQIRI